MAKGKPKDLAQSVNEALSKSDLGIIPVFRQPKKRLFLAAYLKTGLMTKAQAMSGVHRSSHFNWYKEDGAEGTKYRETFDAIQFLINQDIDDEVFRRGVKGYEEGVYWRGQRTSTKRVYSDTLLIFLAKSRMKKYRDEPMQIVGPVTPQVDRQTIRDEMISDPEYLEYLRQKAMAIDVQSESEVVTKPITEATINTEVKALPKPSKNGNSRKR